MRVCDVRLSYSECVLCVVIVEGPPGADDDDDSVTDNFGGEHELFGNCTGIVCYWQLHLACTAVSLFCCPSVIQMDM